MIHGDRLRPAPTLCILLVAALASSGCAGAMIGAGVATGYAVIQERSLGNAVDDTSIKFRINERLMSHDQRLWTKANLDVIEGHVGSLDVSKPREHGAGLQQRDHQAGLEFFRIGKLPEIPVLGLERNPSADARWAFVLDRSTARERVKQWLVICHVAITQQGHQCPELEQAGQRRLSAARCADDDRQTVVEASIMRRLLEERDEWLRSDDGENRFVIPEVLRSSFLERIRHGPAP